MAQKSKTAQDFVPIQEIRNGVIVLKDKSMRMVLMVSSLNFALKSTDEQAAIIYQFQNLLNSLDFPIQILVQSRERDIRPYISLLEERQREQLDDLMRIQIEEYIGFIKAFVSNVNVMSKNFFVVIPYTPSLLATKTSDSPLEKIMSRFSSKSKAKKKPEVQKSEEFEENRSQINQRLSIVEQGLGGAGLRSVVLGTEELIELLYKMFNPGELSKPIAAGSTILEPELGLLNALDEKV